MATKWNGKGAPPSKAAAEEYMKAHHVASSEIKDALAAYDAEFKYDRHPSTAKALANLGDQSRNAVTRQRTSSENKAKDAAEPKTRKPATASRSAASAPKGKTKTDANGLPSLEDFTGTSSHGQPLLPYTAGADVLAGVKVRDAHTGKMRAPRYHELGTLLPVTEGWSPEKTAALQQQMLTIGLYGTNKTRLGTWGSADQEAMAALLTEANVTGRTRTEQLHEWMIHPPTPEELGIALGKEKKPATLRLTNPADVRASAETVSQQLLGHIDTGIVNSAASGYNALESSAQTAANDVANSDTGGSSYDAPTPAAYLEDKIRREKPLEVGAHQFLSTWNNFLSLLGPGGGRLQAEA